MPDRFTKADQFALKMKSTFEDIMKDGITSENGIANELNRRKIPTSRGTEGGWAFSTVHQMLKRIEKLDQQGFGEFSGRFLRPIDNPTKGRTR